MQGAGARLPPCCSCTPGTPSSSHWASREPSSSDSNAACTHRRACCVAVRPALQNRGSRVGRCAADADLVLP